MDINKAREIVRHMGYSYFYDEVDRFTVEEIFSIISDCIFQSSKIQGLLLWEEERDAVLAILENFSDNQLDEIAFSEFALFPEIPGRGRVFFKDLLDKLNESIDKTRPKVYKRFSINKCDVDASGNKVAETRYFPFGEERYTDGTAPTDQTYTGQRSEDFGLMDYNARYYSPLLGKFISADTLIPDPDAFSPWDRYGYVLNNPINRIDPTGHWSCGDAYDAACYENETELEEYIVYIQLPFTILRNV